MSEFPRFDWTDEDGDQGRICLVDGSVELQLFDRETGRESAVYVTADDAAAIVAWLESQVIRRGTKADHTKGCSEAEPHNRTSAA